MVARADEIHAHDLYALSRAGVADEVNVGAGHRVGVRVTTPSAIGRRRSLHRRPRVRDEPIRHRLNRGGNRRLNSVLHLMAMTQLRCEPRAKQIYERARRNRHTKKESMRILKRHLSNIVYRRMINALKTKEIAPVAADPPAA